MSQFRQENFNNIVCIFEQKTGLRFSSSPRKYSFSVKRAALVAAMLTICIALAAFGYPLFSPLNGDALTLDAEYEGDGIISIQVQNHSNRNLEFQPQIKLLKWITGEEVIQNSTNISYDGLSIPAQSQGTLTLDISNAYDMEQLEDSLISEWYYLILTNQNFMFGQEWKCSVYFGQEDPYQDSSPQPLYSLDPRIVSAVEEELRFYFEDDFIGFLAANPLHYDYLQKAQELLMRFEKRSIEAVDSNLIIPMAYAEESLYLEGWVPRISLGQNLTVQDAFGKLVGSTDYEHVLAVNAFVPASEEEDGYSYQVPLLYYSFFEKGAIAEDACTFIHGQIVTFEELAAHKVFENEEFVCFNVTHLFYSDLESYMEDIIEYRIATDQDYYYDEGIQDQLNHILQYFSENFQMVTWEEFKILRGACTLREQPEPEELAANGLSGQIVSDLDIKEVRITITSENETVYSGTFIPDSTDSPWGSYGWELSEATEVNEKLHSLPDGEYTFSLDVLLDTEYDPERGLWECIFTVN